MISGISNSHLSGSLGHGAASFLPKSCLGVCTSVKNGIWMLKIKAFGNWEVEDGTGTISVKGTCPRPDDVAEASTQAQKDLCAKKKLWEKYDKAKEKAAKKAKK